MRHRKTYGDDADRALKTWIELARAFGAVRGKETAYIESRGVTVQQFAALEALYHLGTLTIGELTKKVLSTPGNMTVVIKNLETKGLVNLSKNKKDKRVTMVDISEAGRAVIENIFPQHALNHAEYFSCLDEEESRTLKKLLRKIVINNT